MRLLKRLLRGFIKTGTLELTDAHGSRYLFGAAPGPAVVARIHDRALHIRLALNPELAAAEAYMDGTLTFEGGSTAHDLLLLFSVNRSALGAVASQKLLRQAWRAMRRRHQANTVARATDNARSHYDVPVGIYRLFLDAGLNYSCAFFHDPGTDTLEQAQEAKLARATAKLGLRPGMRVAEIGSGWGSFAVHIAKSAGARVTAINVSPEQLAVSRMLAEREGVTNLVEFLELDYRALEGRFDRVVSVGMMEHVGIGHLDAYFAKIRSLLTEDGYAYVHCIGRYSPPSATGPFIRKYIFPGAYTPSLSEVFAATESTRALGGRHGGAAPALLLHHPLLANPLRREPLGGAGANRRTILPDVGILSVCRRAGVPAWLEDGLPGAAFAEARRGANRAGLHAGAGMAASGGGGEVIAGLTARC